MAAALTLLRGFIAAGKPSQLKPLNGYEDWSSLPRACVVWLGFADPVATQEGLKAVNPEKAALAKVLILISELFQDKEFAAKKLAEEAAKQEPTRQGPLHDARGNINVEHVHEGLFELLREIAPERTNREKINHVALGMYLGKSEGSIAEGRRFRSRIVHKSAIWRVEKVDS